MQTPGPSPRKLKPPDPKRLFEQALTTRDVFHQIHTRLTRVEDDLRELRVQVQAGFAQQLQRIDQVQNRFDQLQWRLVGLFIVTWITVVGSIWLQP